jgi:hypothetical protein
VCGHFVLQKIQFGVVQLKLVAVEGQIKQVPTDGMLNIWEIIVHGVSEFLDFVQNKIYKLPNHRYIIHIVGQHEEFI